MKRAFKTLIWSAILPVTLLFCVFLVSAAESEPITVNKINLGLFKLIAVTLIPFIVFFVMLFLLRTKFKEMLWLKWGIMLEIVLISQVLSFLLCIVTPLCKGEFCGIECLVPVWPQLFISSYLTGPLLSNLGAPLLISFVASFFVYFAIGAFIGCLITKIKSKK